MLHIPSQSPESDKKYSHLGIDHCKEVCLAARSIEISLEVVVSEFVAGFVGTILFPVLLNCIVRQVDHRIRKIVQVE